MFSSLDKIDLEATDPSGTRVFVQTDHRAPEEIEAAAEISVLFGLTRALLPRRLVRDCAVQFAFMHEPPALLRAALAAAGAELDASGGYPPLSADEAEATTAQLADAAFAGLAARICEREGIVINAASVSAFALEQHAHGFDPIDDEICYWTAVAEVAALTGELLRAQFGGEWVDDTHDMTTLPFLFSIGNGDQLVNAAGKAERVLADGASEDPVQLVALGHDAAAHSEGRLMPNFKPEAWEGRGHALWEPLLNDTDNWEKLGASVPLITYGHDHPHSFATLKDGDLLLLRPEAFSNLRHHDVLVEDHSIDDMPMRVAHDSYFACEKILDEVFMQELHEQLGPLLAVGIPSKGLLLASSGMDPQHMPVFRAVVEGYYGDAAAKHALTATVFLVQGGRVVGVLGDADPQPPKSKGLWGRLFG